MTTSPAFSFPQAEDKTRDGLFVAPRNCRANYIPRRYFPGDGAPRRILAAIKSQYVPQDELLRSGQLGGVEYSLVRRIVPQNTISTPVFIITDDVGDLYAFLDRLAAECHWRDMGICAIARKEVA